MDDIIKANFITGDVELLSIMAVMPKEEKRAKSYNEELFSRMRSVLLGGFDNFVFSDSFLTAIRRFEFQGFE